MRHGIGLRRILGAEHSPVARAGGFLFITLDCSSAICIQTRKRCVLSAERRFSLELDVPFTSAPAIAASNGLVHAIFGRAPEMHRFAFS
jgi:hypothetical protein